MDLLGFSNNALVVAILTTFAIYGCKRSDNGYDEAIFHLKEGLKYSLYDEKNSTVIRKGELHSGFVECLKNSQRMYNVYGYEGDVENDLWLENGYGIRLRRVEGKVYRIGFLKKDGNTTLYVSKTYTVDCDFSLLDS